MRDRETLEKTSREWDRQGERLRQKGSDKKDKEKPGAIGVDETFRDRERRHKKRQKER